MPNRRRPAAALQRRQFLATLSLLPLTTLEGCHDDDGDTWSVPAPTSSTQMLLDWNRVAIDASGLDHTPAAAGESRSWGQQLGPGRSSRAMAITHLAVFEAVNAIEGGYRSHVALPPARSGTSVRAAVAQAAHDTLVELFPGQRSRFSALLDGELALAPGGGALRDGIELGRLAASATLERRSGDGADHAEPVYSIDYLADDRPGTWRQDPVSLHPLALGASWSRVHPFVLEHAAQFRVPPPPALDSAEYATAYAEVLRLGGDGRATPTERTLDQTRAGIYWAYDGTPSLCAPPRLYNQVAVRIATARGTAGVHLARLLALVNVGMADAALAAWESKYHYEFWRPVTGIREADPGTGPSGVGDGNPATVADTAFMPLGAPASNLAGPNFTPPFPAYPSGHAVFGGALFQTLRRQYGTDAIAFDFVSDEYDGRTRDADGSVRPVLTRSFASLSEAEEENGQSRIYLGIHWAFDKTAGIEQGRRIADYVWERLLRAQA